MSARGPRSRAPYNRAGMSLVTRCPACGTNFKVVRDQLRISDGWVRCGRCSQVFDASDDLRETPDGGSATPSVAPHDDHKDALAAPASDVDPALPESLPPLPAPLPPPAPVSSPPPLVWPGRDMLDLTTPRAGAVSGGGSSSSKMPLSTDVPFFGLIADEPWPSPPPAAADARPAPSSTPSPDLAHAALPLHPSDAAPVEPAVDLQLQKALRRARVKAAKIAKAREKKDVVTAPVELQQPLEAAVSAPSELPQPSFLESKPVRWPWRWPARGSDMLRPRVLIAIALAAALMLFMQVLRHERDALAARQPGLRPLLSQLCALTGCEVAALRRIGSITIDGAAFARERIGDGYRLSFTLRNDAAVPLAMPAIELSLLDTQERAIVRRVILPSDFGAPPVLAGNAERAASLALALSGAEAAVLPPVAGYRLVAFYP